MSRQLSFDWAVDRTEGKGGAVPFENMRHVPQHMDPLWQILTYGPKNEEEEEIARRHIQRETAKCRKRKQGAPVA